MWIETEVEHRLYHCHDLITHSLRVPVEHRLHSPSLLSLFPLGSSSSDFNLLFLSYLSDRHTLYVYIPDPR